MTRTDDWRTRARQELIRLRGKAKAWGYRAATAPAVEPTALTGLALLAALGPRSASDRDKYVEAAADWLAVLQQPTGALGIAEGQRTPCWTTPYGLALWGALGGYQEPRRRAASWLLEARGMAIPKSYDPEHIVGHDTTLIGWAWVSETHSWLEPTALAVLALRREGYGDHARVREGVNLINDRAIDEGGWNYGNKAAFGHSLRPQPAPTGLALLALAPENKRSTHVGRAVSYLETVLPETRSASALGWGLLGLRAWGIELAKAEVWLAEAFRQVQGRPDSGPRLALLLLAGDEHAWQFFAGNVGGGRRG